MIKIALAGIAIVFLCSQFKNQKNEYSLFIIIGGSVLLLGLSISRLSELINLIDRISSYIAIEDMYIKTLIKIVGITYIGEFTSDLCRDSGNVSIANQIELGAKLSILVLSMPILLSLLDTIESFSIIR